MTRVGLFVRLDETGADGFIPVGSLGADYFLFDEARHALVGRAAARPTGSATAVEVRLVEAAPFAGALRFEMLSRGAESARAPAKGTPQMSRTCVRRRRSAALGLVDAPRARRPLPACGEGRLFRAYLKVDDACPVCGEEFHHHRADDAPAYFTICIVGHFIVAGVVAAEDIWPGTRRAGRRRSSGRPSAPG